MEKSSTELSSGDKRAPSLQIPLEKPGSEAEVAEPNFGAASLGGGDGANPPFQAAPLDRENYPNLGGSKAPNPSKELKERYRWETEFLRRKLGPLEEIRRNLGLSQRKISELLLVDPSSWHRWAKQDSAPGYIYKSLQWFLALRERHPEIASLEWLNTQSSVRETSTLEARLQTLAAEFQELKSNAQNLDSTATRGKFAIPWGFIALGVALGFTFAYWALR